MFILSSLGFPGLFSNPGSTTTPSSNQEPPRTNNAASGAQQPANYFSQMLNMMANNSIVSRF
jgi:hypothetical protein